MAKGGKQEVAAVGHNSYAGTRISEAAGMGADRCPKYVRVVTYWSLILKRNLPTVI